MKQHEYSILGLDVKLEGPDSVEEFDKMAGEQGACLQSAVDNTAYRGAHAAIRARFVDKLAEETGIARKTKTVTLKSTNEDGTPKTQEVPDESEGRYFARVLAETDTEKSDYQDLMDTVITESGIKIDPAQTERMPGKTRIPKTYLKLAEGYAEQGKLDAFAAKLSEILGKEVAANVEACAMAVKENEDRKRKEREAAYAV